MKGEDTWVPMLKHWDNWIALDVLPYFNEVVIVVNGDRERGSVLVEVGDEGKKPYSSVEMDWEGNNGSFMIRHAFDVTEANLVKRREREDKQAKKEATKEKKKKPAKKRTG